MSWFPRSVIGYHGCVEPLATRLLSGELPIDEWKASENAWDWLGHGIYFWEGALRRAHQWAVDKARETGGTPAVIGAVLDLRSCFDLTDEFFTRMLAETHERIAQEMASVDLLLPENVGRDIHRPRRELDCLVINSCLKMTALGAYSSVRAPFWEGPPVYPGAMIHARSHLQIAVRDRSCILGIFKPNTSMR